MKNLSHIKLLGLIALSTILTFNAQARSTSFLDRVLANTLVTITTKAGEKHEYFSALEPTAQALLLPAVQKAAFTSQNKPVTASCHLNLSASPIQTTCEIEDGTSKISVLEQGLAGTHMFCRPEMKLGCDSFKDLCGQAKGQFSANKNGTSSCHILNPGYQKAHQRWIDISSIHQGQHKPTQQACAMKDSIDQFGAIIDDKDETHDVQDHCISVHDCNSQIVQCIVYGGEFTPDTFDPDTGAPETGTCTYKSDDC